MYLDYRIRGGGGGGEEVLKLFFEFHGLAVSFLALTRRVSHSLDFLTKLSHSLIYFVVVCILQT